MAVAELLKNIVVHLRPALDRVGNCPHDVVEGTGMANGVARVVQLCLKGVRHCASHDLQSAGGFSDPELFQIPFAELHHGLMFFLIQKRILSRCCM